MPSRSTDTEYSRNSSDCGSDPQKNDDGPSIEELLAAVDIEALIGTETASEVIADMTAADLNPDVAASETKFDQPAPASPAQEWSKNVLPAWSKNVSARQRRSPSNDAKTLAKIRSFAPNDVSPDGTSLVGNPTPVHNTANSTPLPPQNTSSIPVWTLTSDTVKVFSAAVALQLLEAPPVAFTFNLTPEGISKAERHSAGFLDHLKRSLDLELKRAGIDMPYWFTVDVDDDGRPHIQGAFVAPHHTLSGLRKIRTAMKAAWGEWVGAGKRKQLRFRALYNDGWATYCMRNQQTVAGLIGRRTFTINQRLRRDAEWTYGEIRRIMREDARC